MSREIKFRCWIEKAKAMASWEDILKECDRFSLLSKEGFLFMQYTDSGDKKGDEICEDDILESHDGVRYRVFWNRGEYMTRRLGRVPKPTLTFRIKSVEPLTQWNLHMFKIIGNIHENPELLK